MSGPRRGPRGLARLKSRAKFNRRYAAYRASHGDSLLIDRNAPEIHIRGQTIPVVEGVRVV